MFAYWCRPCKAWWPADLTDETIERVRKLQRSSIAKVSPLIRPGQAHCPLCGRTSTQDLPTEIMGGH